MTKTRSPQWTQRTQRFLRAISFVSIVSFVVAAPARAQMTGAPTAGYKPEPGAVASSIPRPLREIGFDQHLDQTLPLDTPFTDERGQTVRLAQYFGSKPVVLAFVYYSCPMLCTQVLNAMTSTLSVLSLDAGKDFEVVLVGFDPREKPEQAAAKKAEQLQRYKRPGADAGWHFLTGSEPAIKTVASAAGFRYVWDEPTNQFAHPTGIIIVTPDGRPARYLFGIEYGPRDVRFALLEASAGKIGSVADSLLLYCYHYDPMTGRYGLYIMRTLRIAGVATVLLIATFIIVMVRRERSTTAAWHAAARVQSPGLRPKV
jgi:protein SCO1/2